MSEWKTIATAPKDGTLIDIFAEQWVLASKKEPPVKRSVRWPNCYWHEKSKEWLSAADPESPSARLIEQEWSLTHWMPLPSPPVTD